MRAITGEVCSPNPPCPTSQKKPSASGRETDDRAAVGREGAKARPAAVDALDLDDCPLLDPSGGERHLIFVRLRVHGSLGTSSIGEANSRPLSGAK